MRVRCWEGVDRCPCCVDELSVRATWACSQGGGMGIGGVGEPEEATEWNGNGLCPCASERYAHVNE